MCALKIALFQKYFDYGNFVESGHCMQHNVAEATSNLMITDQPRIIRLPYVRLMYYILILM